MDQKMARFTEIVCWMSAIFFSLISLGLTHPIIERQMQSHGSTDAFYHQVQTAGKTVRKNVPVPHLIQHKKAQLNVTASSFQDDISKKLSDLQAKFEELSDQNEAMRRRLDERVNLNQNIDALAGKLGRILGERYDGDTLGKLINELGDDDGRMDERINTVSEYLGNREAELVGYVHNQPLSSSIPFLVNQLRQEPSSDETKAVIDVIAKLSVQQSHSAESRTDDDEISPGAPNKEELHNGSANVIKGSVLMPARLVPSTESALHSIDTDGVTASRKIAFSAAATKPQFGSDVAQTVLFQDVMENIGGGFLASNHTFICTVPGLYYFTYSLRTADGKYLGVLLMKNAEYVVGVYTDASDRNTMETQSTVIALQAGDAVWLRLGPNSEYGLFSDSHRYSTFTGFLLFKE